MKNLRVIKCNDLESALVRETDARLLLMMLVYRQNVTRVCKKTKEKRKKF
ncbi:MAG: hypothetical protein ACI4HI_07360 [Lachnospiraceae bacterium]